MLGHHVALGLLSMFLLLQSYVYSQPGFDELKLLSFETLLRQRDMAVFASLRGVSKLDKF